MFIRKLKPEKGNISYRFRVVFSLHIKDLKKLESRLTIQAFSSFQVKSCQPYKDGFVSVWRIPKRLKTLNDFDNSYLAATYSRSIRHANEKHDRAVQRLKRLQDYKKAREERERAERILKEAERKLRRAENRWTAKDMADYQHKYWIKQKAEQKKQESAERNFEAMTKRIARIQKKKSLSRPCNILKGLVKDDDI